MNQKARHIILLVMGLCLGKSGQEDDSVAENIDVPKTIDNVSCRLGDDIANFLDSNAVVYVASSGFSLSAFEHLADELEGLKSVRFVFTTPSFVPQDAVKEKIKKERREFFIPGVGEASILGGALLGDSPIYRLCREFGETDNLTASGVTTLEAALVRWSAALVGMGVRAGDGVRAFAERHYRLEALRAQSADLEKKIVREKQLDRKYELVKEKRQLEKEVSLWLK